MFKAPMQSGSGTAAAAANYGPAWFNEESQGADDSLCVAAARQGDRSAFETLVRKYQQRLCNSLVHVCGSVVDAQDAAQEAFVRAYVKLGSFNGQSVFYTWLHRIGINCAISNHRKEQHRPVELSHAVLGREPADTSEAPDERLLREERVAQVQRALAALGELQRTILVLREIDGCDYDTIAEILDIPVGTVRSRLHRARLQLREQLEALCGRASDHQARLSHQATILPRS